MSSLSMKVRVWVKPGAQAKQHWFSPSKEQRNHRVLRPSSELRTAPAPSAYSLKFPPQSFRLFLLQPINLFPELLCFLSPSTPNCKHHSLWGFGVFFFLTSFLTEKQEGVRKVRSTDVRTLEGPCSGDSLPRPRSSAPAKALTCVVCVLLTNSRVSPASQPS